MRILLLCHRFNSLSQRFYCELSEKGHEVSVELGDRGYRGCDGVIVCDSREMRAIRQVVEGVISQIMLFNAGSGWRTLTCVLVYVYAYAIGYSYYRRGELEA